jgi:hypothetical protein
LIHLGLNKETKEEMEQIEPFLLRFISLLSLNNSKKLKIYYNRKSPAQYFSVWLIFGIVFGIHNKKIELQYKPKSIELMNKKIKLPLKYQSSWQDASLKTLKRNLKRRFKP